MDNKTLKSSIKAYCLELMQEMSALGGEGAYMAKFAGRKVTSKDKTSPTGFETSPKNNYYKKFKFRVTNPYPRKNSKQLWNEIKVLKPGTIEFPIYLNNQEKAIEIGKKLFKLNYYWLNDQKPDWTNAPFKTNNFEPFKIFLVNEREKIIDYEYTNEVEPVQEIKISKPIRKARVISGDGYDVLVYKSGIKYKDNPEEIDKSLMDQKLYYNFDDDYKNSTTFSLISFVGDNKKEKIWWDDDEIRFGINENKKEFIHRINKEIYQRLDEINNHIEYTSKIKGSEDKEINELNNLKNSLLKIKSKINEIKINKPGLNNLNYSDLYKLIRKADNIDENQTDKILYSYGFPSLFMTDEKEKIEWWDETTISDKQNLIFDLKKVINSQNLKEIKINKPKRVWDFTRYIPNFDPNMIKKDDTIIIPKDYSGTFNKLLKFKVLDIEIDDNNELSFFSGYDGYWTGDFLTLINNKQK